LLKLILSLKNSPVSAERLQLMVVAGCRRSLVKQIAAPRIP
jgi:hypothetical protein